MKTVTVDHDLIVTALMDTQHASKPPQAYRVAFNPDDGSPIAARVIYADTPSSAADFQGEINVNLLDFLNDDDGRLSFTWGKAGQGTGPNGETTDADKNLARWWIASNLVDEINVDGESHAIVYTL